MIQNIENQSYIESYLNNKYRSSFSFGDCVSRPINIWKLHFDQSVVSHHRLIIDIKKLKGVVEAQVNHIIENRATLPNDPNISSQWQYVNTGSNGGLVDADIDADDAWDITTGGVNMAGDSIVVCVIDDGADLSHPDWGNNIWTNSSEIQGNGIDDDGNGYVDDHQGWNTDNNSNDISGGTWGGSHGTPVAGIVGAQGDNQIGVSGVNWNVKIMVVIGGGNEADALSAYSYPLVMRKLYEQSNGAKGAYVVSTNASWGVNYGKAADAPLWCAMYDSLGSYGILSAGATANLNVNVDVDGDLPTQCPSDYLIAVTNMDRTDTKVGAAGYGATTIDIGAFGADAYTMEKGGSYGGFGGTSGASPHVAGAIALLHSSPCAEFSQLIDNDPVLGARLIKKYILDGSDPNSSLSGITVSQSRLNIHKALMEIENRCGTFSCLEPMLLKVDSLKSGKAWISWSSPPGATSFEIQYRDKNTSTWKIDSSNQTSVLLDSLPLCKNYEIIVRTKCDTLGYSPFSDTLDISTSGCCQVPVNLSLVNKTETSAKVDWDSVYAQNTIYNLMYDELNVGSWTTITGILTNTYQIMGLDTCTNYQLKVQADCDGQATAYSSILDFNTEGCEACLNPNYCPSEGDQVVDEWIDGVVLGNIQNNSGSNNGYADFTSLSTRLFKDSTYSMTLTPGYSSSSYDEYFAVWIDYNQDSDFEDNGEEVYLSSSSTLTAINFNFSVDPNAKLGSTRMRVSMKYNSAPDACEASIPYGEVEDYCVEIDTLTSSIDISELSSPQLNIYPNPFKEVLQLKDLKLGGQLSITNVLGELVYTSHVTSINMLINLEELVKGPYLLKYEHGDLVKYRRVIKTQ
jgi:hypothetical protein